ncbi:MAG TPA: TonB-dependent receptor [candidate division Zixibacteria bacterium]
MRLRFHALCAWWPALAVSLCVLAVTLPALGGTTGKLSGRVIDTETGQPIAGALVRVLNTDIETYTDAKGRYTILNMPVGRYTLVASLLSAQPAADQTELLLFQEIEVRNLKVSVDLDTEQDIQLSSKPIEMGTIVVVAERPLVLKDRTASLRIVESDQIRTMPTRGYRELVALQPGVVVRNGNLLNVRGGRTSEVAYFVDGFSQQDPLTGISTTQINNNDLEEVSIVTGGFNAEYGWIASGAVNVTTRDGGDKLSGTIETITDNFHGNSYDYNVYNSSLSGPLVGLTDDVRFIVSGERRWFGDRDPSAIAGGPLPHNHSGGWTWRGKVNWQLGNGLELKAGGLQSTDSWKLWLSPWQFNMEHAPRLEDFNQSANVTLEHVINPRTFYTVSGSYFVTERERGDGVHFEDIWTYGRPGVLSTLDQTQLFRTWDDINGPTEIEDTVIDGRTYTLRGDEAAIWNNYLHRRSSYAGFDADLVSQLHPRHEVRAGLDYQRHTLRRYEHVIPSLVWRGVDGGGFQDVDRYGYSITGEQEEDEGLQGAKHPETFAAFVQDKFELDGLVLNAGVRLDYLDVNTDRLRDPENPLDPDHYLDQENPTDEQRELAGQLDPEDLEASRPEVALSPRLGVAFPISDVSVFHASYGRFMQRPDLMNLYVSYEFLEYQVQNGKYYFPFGNPNLRPERTIAYEVGWTRQLGDNTSLDVTAYYKDVGDLTQVVNQPAQPFSFASYRNTDFGTIKGLELTFDMRRASNIALHFSYTMAHATGTGSDPNSQSNIAWTQAQPPTVASPLDYDQRHKFVGIFDLRSRPGEGPSLGGWHFLENAGLNVTMQTGSGFPYTPQAVSNEVTEAATRIDPIGGINSRYAEWTMQVDLKATRGLRFGGLNTELELVVINLFDRDNVRDVFASTGLPNSTGWLQTEDGQDFIDAYDDAHDSSGLTGEEKYRLRENDPTNYGVPRQIRAGMRIYF